jgi:hypothetical protein
MKSLSLDPGDCWQEKAASPGYEQLPQTLSNSDKGRSPAQQRLFASAGATGGRNSAGCTASVRDGRAGGSAAVVPDGPTESDVGAGVDEEAELTNFYFFCQVVQKMIGRTYNLWELFADQ